MTPTNITSRRGGRTRAATKNKRGLLFEEGREKKCREAGEGKIPIQMTKTGKDQNQNTKKERAREEMGKSIWGTMEGGREKLSTLRHANRPGKEKNTAGKHAKRKE